MSQRKRVLMHGLLGELLQNIEAVEDPADGFYALFAPSRIISVSENTPAAIILNLNDDDDGYLPDYAAKNNLEPICIVDDAKSVVRVAKDDKPTATTADFVAALNYYMEFDAFLDLTQSSE